MVVKDFSQVFNGIEHYLDEEVAKRLEAEFIDDGMFEWNASYRNVGRFDTFIRNITAYPLGLQEGEVVKFLSSLGCRLIFIGTFAGNMVIHQRLSYGQSTHEGPPESCPAIVSCYVPKVLEPIIGNKPLKQADLYRYTGHFNENDNIGKALGRIRSLSTEAA